LRYHSLVIASLKDGTLTYKGNKMKTYEQLEKSNSTMRIIMVFLAIITVVAWTSSAMTNRDARVLLNDNKLKADEIRKLEEQYATTRYQLHEAQGECINNIEEVMSKVGVRA